MIHNGIIENFQALRAGLEKAGHALASDTDTECIAHLIEEHVRDGAGLADAVRATVRELDGAYAIVVLSADDPELIVGVKVSSPLVVGIGDGETILASDIPAVLDRTTTVIPVDEGQVVEVRRDGVAFTDFDGNPVEPEPITVDWDIARAQKGGFDDFMLKEIHEQPAAIRDTLVGRVVEGRLDAGRAADGRRRAARGRQGVRRRVRDGVPFRPRREVRDRALDARCRWRSRSPASSATATRCWAPTR